MLHAGVRCLATAVGKRVRPGLVNRAIDIDTLHTGAERITLFDAGRRQGTSGAALAAHGGAQAHGGNRDDDRTLTMQEIVDFSHSIASLPRPKRHATAALAPSLYYYLHQKGGISFADATQLCLKGRLLLKGQPITNPEALTQQGAYEDVSRLPLVVVNDAGKACAVADRHLHRTYVKVFLRGNTGRFPEIEDPRSYLHQFPLLAVSSSSPPRDGDVDGHSAQREVSPADDDSGTSPVQTFLLRAVGCVRGMEGVGVVTNDAVMAQHIAQPAVGAYGVFHIILHPGTPPDEVKDMILWLEAHAERPAKANDTPSGEDEDDDAAREGTTAAQREAGMPQQKAKPALAFALPDPPDYVLSANGRSSVVTAPPVISVTTGRFTSQMLSEVKRRLAPLKIRCVRFGDSVVLPPSWKEPGMSSVLQGEELSALFAEERRRKVHRLIWSLRDVMD